ncbi:MAG: trypsin-like peptidase domain-containing protein [Gammaproteobacteria bacterium]
MKHLNKIVFFFLVTCCLLMSAGNASDLTCHWPSSRVLGSIVPIESGKNSHASGVVVSNNLVLTAAHVLEDYYETVVAINNEMYLASVLLVDKEADIALLSVRTENLYPIPLSKYDLYERQEVWAVGYPRAQSLHTSSGNFVAKKAEAIHTSAGIDSGASGGGLLSCEHGEFVLAGMLRGYGAYRTDQGLVRLEDYSISVAASDIKFTLDLSYNEY